MANTGQRRHPDRGRALDVLRSLTALFALIGVALAGAACTGSVAAQAVAPGDDTGQEPQALTALGEAAFYGDIETVERLLGEGADVDAASATGMTPLMWSFQPLILPPTTSGPDPAAFQAFRARQMRKLRIAGLLLDRGADLALANRDGMTALHYLVLMYVEEPALLETLQAFMANGADPDVSNGDGTTPLMLAAQRDRLQVATYLLSAGADPKATAKDGRTALSIALERGHAEMAGLLERQLQ